MSFPTIIFLFIGLISGAGALLSYASYKRAKNSALNTPSSPLSLSPPDSDARVPDIPEVFEEASKVKGRDLKKAVEEAVKPHVERVGKLEAELEKTNQLVADLKTAAQLAPEPKNGNKKKPPAKKQNNNKGSSK